MSDWISRQLRNRWLLNITVMLFIFFSLDAIATAFVSVMIDTTWSELSGTQRWIRVALVVKAWASAMMAFLTNSAKRLEKEISPLGGDTDILTKTEPKP